MNLLPAFNRVKILIRFPEALENFLNFKKLYDYNFSSIKLLEN